MAQVFRHGNAEVAVELRDRVLHFTPKVLALTVVPRIDVGAVGDPGEHIRTAIDEAITEAVDVYGRDLKVALQAAFDWAEERYGVGQLT